LTLRNNTVYQLIGDAVNLSGSTNATYPVTIENNILWVEAGYDLHILTSNQTGFISDYNILYHTGAQAGVGTWNGSVESTLAAWQTASSMDSHSSEANPLFVDPAGADAVLGYSATAQGGNGYNGGNDDNFFVDAGSPAILAGNAAFEPATDLLGYPYNKDIGAYAYRGVAADSVPPTVVSVTPTVSQIAVVFSQTPNDIDARAASLYTLVGAGTGGSFTASDAIVYALTPTYQQGTDQVVLTVNGGPLPANLYQLTIESNTTASVHNLAGVALDGNGDGLPGSNYVTTFTLAAPVVTGVSPSSGPTTGGTTVTITGTNFTGTTAVTFGGVAATDVTVNSAGTQITAVDPAGTAGEVDILVTTPSGGTSAPVTADQFAYAAPPTVVSVTPEDDAGNGVAAGSAAKGQRSMETQIAVVFSEPVKLASGAFTLNLVNN
jgi:hypothetical protein